MYQPSEDDLKILQELIPGATVENLQAFQECMKTEAVYKSALPYGITSAVLSHFLLPKQLGTAKSVITAITGFTAFMFGKIMYSPFCKEKVFGPSSQVAFKPQERRGLYDNSSYGDSSDAQDQQSKLVLSSDKLLEDDSQWKNYDTFSDNVNPFDDTGNNFQDELITEQPTEVKRRVTYDDLWAQHSENRRREQYRDYRGGPINRERMVPPQRFSEKAAPPETSFDEKNTWV